MKKKISIISFVLIISMFFYSCGTILHGTSEMVSVRSTPTSASVTVKNDKGLVVAHGKTPKTFKLSKKSDYSILIKLDGYKDQTAYVSTSWNALYGLLSIFCGGLVGIVVDLITGGWNDLEPLEINVTLETAYNDNDEEQLFIFFTGRDEEGILHQLRVPLLKK